jgi:2-hydroxychromene-2-carboxylate isomerase
MSIYDLQRSKKLRELGRTLGREGVALFVKEIAEQIVAANSYREMIIFAGKIAAAVQACGFDGYWSEKAELGKQDGVYLLARAADRIKNKS